jgi:hypothetical protein
VFLVLGMLTLFSIGCRCVGDGRVGGVVVMPWWWP